MAGALAAIMTSPLHTFESANHYSFASCQVFSHRDKKTRAGWTLLFSYHITDSECFFPLLNVGVPAYSASAIRGQCLSAEFFKSGLSFASEISFGGLAAS